MLIIREICNTTRLDVNASTIRSAANRAVTFAKILQLILGLAAMIGGRIRDKRLARVGETRQKLEQMRHDKDTAAAAAAARRAAVRAFDAGGVRDDPNRRD